MSDGAPARNQAAIRASKIMQPNEDVRMKGQIGFAPQMVRKVPGGMHQPSESDIPM